MTNLIDAPGRLRRFAAARGGNIAILTALLLVPVVGMGGIAVDHSLASMQHARITAAADSTALLGARRAKIKIEERPGNAQLEYLDTQLTRYFKDETKDITGLTYRVDILRNDTDVEVNVTWNVMMPSIFGKIFGRSSYDLAGTSRSIVSLQRYLNLFVLVDVSQSMGIGATQADQQRMFAREGCMFACHLPAKLTDSKLYPGKTTYEAARMASPPIDTRVDIARNGVLQIVEMAKEEANGSSDRIKLGVYTFSNSLGEIVPIESPVSGQYDEISKLVRTKLVLGKDEGGSNLMAALRELDAKITRTGEGFTPDAPQVVLIVLSDAVANSTTLKMNGSGIWLTAQQPFHALSPGSMGAIQMPRSDDYPSPDASQVTVNGKTQPDLGRMGAIDPRVCGVLKDRGVTMMMIETPYVIPQAAYRATSWGTEDIRFAWFETNGRLPAISNRMRECASGPDYFAMAGSSEAINLTLRKMAELALKNQLRLAK